MAAFIHTFAPPGALVRTERNKLASASARGVGSLTCRWRHGSDGGLVALWSRTLKEAGDEPASSAFAAAA